MTREEIIELIKNVAGSIHSKTVPISDGGLPDQDTEWIAIELLHLIGRLEQRPRK